MQEDETQDLIYGWEESLDENNNLLPVVLPGKFHVQKRTSRLQFMGP